MKIETLGCIISLSVWLCTGVAAAQPAENIPFDSSNPVIWDNDGAYDNFTQEFVMALAHNGTIKLLGISGEPCVRLPGTEVNKFPCDAQKAKYGAKDVVHFARQIGFNLIVDNLDNPSDPLPLDATVDPVNVYNYAVDKPASGSIDDTQPVVSLRAEMIMRQVLENGTKDKPVVLAAGGPLTTIASAYLMSKNYKKDKNDEREQPRDARAEFAEKSIVSVVLGGTQGEYPITIQRFNARMDEWAAYVCLKRLRVVIVDHTQNSPVVWDYLNTLPDTVNGLPNRLKQYIIEKKLPENWVYEDAFQNDIPKFNPYWHSDCDAGPLLIGLLPTAGNFFRTTYRIAPDSDDEWGPWPTNIDDSYLHPNSLKEELRIKIVSAAESDDIYVTDFDITVGENRWKSEMDAAFKNVPQEPELISWWKFDETSGDATDSSGKGNHGKISGNPVWEPSGGKIGGSLKLDASGDSLFVEPQVRPTTAFTIAYWIYPTAVAADASIFADFNWGTSFNGILLDHNADPLYEGSINLRTGSGQSSNSVGKVYTPKDTIVPGQWIHIAVTWKNNVTKFYKNGSLITTTGTTNSGSTISYTGSTGLRLAPDINAKIDDFRVYNHVLSADLIEALAKVPTAPKVPAAPGGLIVR